MDELLSIISLGLDQASINEDGGTVQIPVERTGNLDNVVSFDYSIVGVDAIDGEDFIASSGTLTFEAQQTLVEIPVVILNDSVPETTEAFNVLIGEPSPGGELGAIRTAVIAIQDDDAVAPNTIDFSQSAYDIREDGGVATITVFRSSGSDQVATVDYATGDDYARAGSDYASASGTLTFVPGETSQTFTVAITDDDLVERDESLQLSLSNPVGATLGAQDVAKLTIREDATSPYLFDEQIVVSGLSEDGAANFSPLGPTVFDWTPDGAMFIGKLNGVVQIFENGELLAEPFIDISASVNTGGQRGLLGMAVHPEFATNPYVYLAFSYDPPDVEPDLSDAPRVTRLVRLEADPATGYRTALPGSEVVLLETGLVNNFHAAGALKFGNDGALYFSHGDGEAVGGPGSPELPEVLSSRDNVLGKLLRMNPITGEGLPDNPWYNGDPTDIESKIYNYGLRNPWRYTLHPETDEPFMGDVGLGTWEEINRGVGNFFGWPLYEGGNGVSVRTPFYAESDAFQDLYNAVENSTDPPLVAPIYAENHADRPGAVSLGDFYTGTALPEIYQDALFFTNFNIGGIKALVFDESGAFDSAIPFDTRSGTVGIAYMAMGPDDNLYFANLLSGEIGYWELVGAATEEVVWAINAGGSALIQDGIKYLPDQFFLNGDFFGDGEVGNGEQPGFDGTAYETERNGTEINYSIPVSPGEYAVELQFAELFFSTPGSRIFDVTVEGQLVLDDFDILAETGGDFNQPVSFTFNVLSDAFGATDAIDISFQASVDQAKISGIVIRDGDGDAGDGAPPIIPPPPPIIPPPPSVSPVVAINVGGSALTQDGIAFEADDFFVESFDTYTDGTFDPDESAFDGTIYETERFGSPLTYSIPVAPGDYIVELYFAEIFQTQPGARIFDIEVEGQLVFDDLDILAQTGDATQPFIFKLPDTVSPDSFGASDAIDISLQASVDSAKLSGIVIRAEDEVPSTSTSQIFWSNDLTQQTSWWEMNGGTIVSAEYISQLPEPGWNPHVGDFTGDGQSDVFWLNDITQQTSLWEMNGSEVVAAEYISQLPEPGWNPHVGDFTGDGKSDVFWLNENTQQTSLWEMDGTEVVAAEYISQLSEPGWNPHVGDFTGDGKSDVFWFNDITQQTSLWEMNGSEVVNAEYISQVPEAGWNPHVGDFTGDGKSDIFWLNDITQQTSLWEMDGDEILNAGYISQLPEPGWNPHVGDLNGDDQSDVFWVNEITQQTSWWEMAGSTVVTAEYISQLPEPGWNPQIINNAEQPLLQV